MDHFLFATGIECSYPTVNGRRRDQLEETGHYEWWRRDLELCQEVGAQLVRYGVPYYRMHVGPHDYDWEFADEVLPVMRQMGIIPIVDLCHFGLPDWVGDFQNTEWPDLFAQFARAFAERYPWIRFYTPVNELFVCARFSAKEGIWNEGLKSDKAMITAHANQCRATLLAVEGIRVVRPDAVFFQSETCEVFLEEDPSVRTDVEFRNALRFITFDFLYGRPPEGLLLTFLFDNGMQREQYDWFMRHGRAAGAHCVMGLDYYEGNERCVDSRGEIERGVTLGWAAIAKEYYDRYKKPIMLTETNVGQAERGADWLWKTWHSAAHLRNQGVPVIGYTWYSLQNQVDWDIQLRAFHGREVPNGLYDLKRQPQLAAQAFQDLCRRYGSEPLLKNFGAVGLASRANQSPRHGVMDRLADALH